MTARDVMLARIRGALSASRVRVPEHAEDGLDMGPGYRARSEMDTEAMLDLLADRLADYRCSVRRCAEPELRATIAAALADRGARRVVLPTELDLPLPNPADVGPGSEWVLDDGLSPNALDACDAVITTATVAIAETGTIVLDGSAGQGRRALTLIPDYHLCVLYNHQIVGLVPEAVAMLTPHRPLTWISGPSATSDIELDRVEGVHGPRTLEVILVSDPTRSIGKISPHPVHEIHDLGELTALFTENSPIKEKSPRSCARYRAVARNVQPSRGRCQAIGPSLGHGPGGTTPIVGPLPVP